MHIRMSVPTRVPCFLLIFSSFYLFFFLLPVPTLAGKDSESVAVSSDTDSEKPAKKSKKGKSVTWASDDKINTYHFFEMDEDERGEAY